MSADPVDERSKSYAALRKRNEEAWKESAASGPTGDAFHDAIMAVHERYDIGPLLAVLRSKRPLSSADRESLARLIDLLHTFGQARKAGAPGGKIWRWRKPNYIAAYHVERRLAALRQNTGRRYISDAEKKKLVDDVMGEMKGWVLMRGKRLYKDQILRLLREPKNRRL